MQMILYGAPGTRASRSLWALEEIGVPYQHVSTWPVTESHTPEFLALNPNGKVPVLDDGGFVLWEGGAINIYLAEKYGGARWAPQTPQARADFIRWTLWGHTEAELAMIAISLAQDAKQRARAIAAFGRPLRVLEGVLAERGHLAGPDFGMIDLNVAGSLRHCHEPGPIADWTDFDMNAFPRVAEWLERSIARPASQRVKAKALADTRGR